MQTCHCSPRPAGEESYLTLPWTRFATARLKPTIALVAAGLWTGVRADSVVQHASVILTGSMPNTTISFAPFDSSLGSLESVELQFVLTRRHAAGIWNVVPDAPEVPFRASLAGSRVQLGSRLLEFSRVEYGPSKTLPLVAIGGAEFLADFQQGRARFDAGQSPAFASAFQFEDQSTLTGILRLGSDFDGELELAFDPGRWTVAAENSYAVSLTDLRGELSATYHYTAVPEPSALGIGILALIGVAAHHRLRAARNRHPSYS